jgi:hypothetical protein
MRERLGHYHDSPPLRDVPDTRRLAMIEHENDNTIQG